MDPQEPPDPKEPLAHVRREAFARAVARGVSGAKAFRTAGLGRSRGAAWATGRRPEVQARIEVLARREARIAMAATAPTLAALVRIVESVRGATGARAREARLTLRLIGELRALVDDETRVAVEPPPRARVPIRPMTTEEWMAKFAHLGDSWNNRGNG